LWSLTVPLLVLLAGCAADGADLPTPSAGETSSVSSLSDEEQFAEIQEELSFRPLCSKCAQICQPLRGYFKKLCTRVCQDSCVTPCEQCKDNCKTLQGSARQQCINTCTSSPACAGPARCGNGRVEGAEQCDDGNTANNDGCSKTCQLEIVCGNGRIDAGEQCDDSNKVSGDGCSATCQIEDRCGDGRISGTEQCDDNNTANNDGCSSLCRVETCGDGVLQTPRETCDDGNTTGNDGCSATCVIERCGDGVTQPPRETCDDSNTVGGDGCSAVCIIEPQPKCGDGAINAPGEECDDNNLSNNDGCSEMCKIERCGDGVLQTPREVCDDGNLLNNDGCSGSCVPEECGDGVRQTGEQCEDGNRVGNDGCSPTCKIERCGDGVVQPPEQCDDGNLVPGDGCELNCTSAVVGPSCEQCRAGNCTDFQGENLVDGCFTAINPEFGADAGDPVFIQQCVNVVTCARANNCAYGSEVGPLACYCGSSSQESCLVDGPAANAACGAEWRAAARSTINTDVFGSLSDLSKPIAWAYYMLDCDRTSCNSPTTGDCTGPKATSSSKPSYVVPVAAGVSTRAILTVGDSTNHKPDGTAYRMVGIPDGLGAFDNNDGTFTMLSNQELGNTAGIARAHGGVGSFVSRWTVRKSDLSVLRGEDLIKTVLLWSPGLGSYVPGTNVAFGRFCSADLPATSAFFAGGVGFNGRLFLDGEENGNEGRAMAHGLDGTSWELPRLGKASWENLVASPFAQAKTIVIGQDDSTPGQVYVYVGTKTNTGTAIDKAGLSNGTLYGVAVPGVAVEPSATGIPAGSFTLASLGNVDALSGGTLDTNSTNAGVTKFNRPEDGAWDPSHPSDYYFVTTNAITAPSRLWRLRFQDIAQPELGGSIEMMLDGTEGQLMLDNMAIDGRGHIMLVEDVGNNAHIGQVFRYDIASDTLTTVAQHDPALFVTGAPGFLTQDEEASGVIDASALLGKGWWLLDVQAHYTIAGELVEGGQYVAMFDPGSL
jgi:cysteine-rich repeat protein